MTRQNSSEMTSTWREGALRGRRILLAGSALAAALTMTVTLAPRPALALVPGPITNNACGAGPTVTCTSEGNPYAAGISYSTPGIQDPTIVLQSGVTVADVGFSPGVSEVSTSYGGGTITISGPTGVTITTYNSNVAGVSVQAADSAVVVNVNGVYTYGAGAGGVSASSGGPVTITASNIATGGANSAGVYGSSTGSVPIQTADQHRGAVTIPAGDLTINASNITTNGPNSPAVYGVSNGNATVTLGGAITTTGNSSTGVEVILTNASTGLASVTAGAETSISTSGSGSPGVALQANGISGSVYANLNSVSTSGSLSDGVAASTDNGSINLVLGTVTTTGASSYGVQASANGSGGVAVSVRSVRSTGKYATGVVAESFYGTASVTAGNVVTYGSGSAGVRVSGGGGASATVGNVTTYGANAPGVSAYSRYGNVAVTLNGSLITTGDHSPGIVASVRDVYSVGNPASIVVTGAAGSTITTTGAYSDGVKVTNYQAGGSVTVNVDTVKTSGYESYGVKVNTSVAPVTVTARSITTTGEYTDGVGVFTSGGNININVGTVTASGYNSYGVQADAGQRFGNGASLHGSRAVAKQQKYSYSTITAGTITTTGYKSDGIYAFARYGAISVTAQNVTTSGDRSPAIRANGYGDVSVTAGTIVTSGANSNGIEAYSYNGNTTVKATSITTSGNYSHGVYAGSQYGNVSVTVGSVTTKGKYSDAVNVYSGHGTINVTVNGHLSTYSGDTIRAYGSGAPINITVSKTGIVDSPYNGYAIHTTGGNATVANAGTINGGIELGAGAYANTVNNTGTFNAEFNSYFAAGGGGAPTALPGRSPGHPRPTADGGGVGSDVFNNSGVLNILPGTSSAGNVTFVNLGTFDNTGLVSMVNGHVGDSFTLPGAFIGGTGSTVALDVNLSGAGSQTGCGPGTVADCLILTGGAVSGTTKLKLVNIGTAPSGENTTGLVLISGSGTAGHFVIDPTTVGYELKNGQGVINAGFFFYHLAQTSPTTLALVSAPDSSAYEVTEIGAAVSDTWYATTASWFDREAEVRQQGNGHDKALWLRFVGDWSDRTYGETANSAGTNFTFDTSYNQFTWGLVGGLDVVRASGKDASFTIGLEGGYVESNVRFRDAASYVSMNGGVVGGYATLTSGGFYVDGEVNANLMSLRDTLPSLGISAGMLGHYATKGAVSVLGAQAETGYDLQLGKARLEPFASLSVSGTHFDNLSIPGGDIQFRSGETARGSIGVRLSTVTTFQTYRIQPSVYVRGWDEWSGRTDTSLLSAGTTVTNSSGIGGSYGDVGGQVALLARGGVQAFVDGSYKFKTNYNDYTFQIGLRYPF